LVGEYNKYQRIGRWTKWDRYKNQLKGARTYPPNGAEVVPTDVCITVIFIEPISEYTLTLKDDNDKTIGGKTSLREDCKALEFKPSRLAGSTTYTATITGVKNKKNKTISRHKTWSFTTAKQSGLSHATNDHMDSFGVSPINIPH